MIETLTREQWNAFVQTAPNASFFHTWEWGELQAKMHAPFWRLSLKNQAGGIDAAALVVKRELPLGRSWLYIPRGPLFAPTLKLEQVWPEFQTLIEGVAAKERALFIRLDPAWPPATRTMLTQHGWAKAERDVQPQHTILVDLRRSEEELLAAMHQKTRYNIRVAEKKGVTIRFASDAASIETFLKVSGDVQGRSAFRYHPPAYYHAMQAVLAPAGMLEVALAEHEGTALAAHILITSNGTVTYAHGASSSTKRQLMAPQLLQWRSIQRAKAAGNHAYDFFGVAPAEADSTHPWAGITRFKEGFGGQRVSYTGTYDYIMEPTAYRLFTVARRLRKVWR